MNLVTRCSMTALLALPLLAAAQGYPNKAIRMVVPLAAGSAVDNAARLVVQKMGESLGQGISVENIAGASGVIGAEKLARSTPDGYTIGGFNDSILTMVPHLTPKLTWDPLKDFAPISLVGTIEWGLVVKTDSPYRTLADFIGAAKAAPGKLNYGSGGNGSPQHIGMALLMDQAKIDVVHVPYKGATPAAVGVAAGEVEVSMQGLGTVTSLVNGGKLRLLAVSTPERLPQFPDVPTFHEAGVPDFTFNSWFAMVAPAGTPPEIIKRLSNETRAAINDPATREKLLAIGVTPRGTTPEEFGEATRAQFERYRQLIQGKGISTN